MAQQPKYHDEFSEESTCGQCLGTATLQDVRTVNGWINAASAFKRAKYECEDCGRTGSVSETGERTGCMAAPTGPEAER